MISRTFTKKVLQVVGIGFFALTLSLSSLSFGATKVHAQAVVAEANPAVITGEVSGFFEKVWNLSTKVGLDKIAWMTAKKAIQSMTKSTVNWIRTGRGGASMYATNLQKDMLQLGDAVAGDFISDIVGTTFFCSPFRLELASMIDLNYFRYTNKGGFFESNTCTLSGLWGSVSDFYDGFVKDNDFSKGGWQGWYELTTKPQNNIYGAYTNASAELGARLTNAQGDQLRLLDWAQGFFSWCGDEPKTGTTTTAKLNNETCRDAKGNPKPIKTPGSVIQNQLTGTLGSTFRQLELADSFNEIIFAAGTELVQGLTRSGGDGLAGVVSQYLRPSTFLGELLGDKKSGDGTDEREQGYSPGTRAIKGLITSILEQIDTVNDAKSKTAKLSTAAEKAVKDLTTLKTKQYQQAPTTWVCPITAQAAIDDLKPVSTYVTNVQDKSNKALDNLELMLAENQALVEQLVTIENQKFDLEEEKAAIQKKTELSDADIARVVQIDEILRVQVSEDLIKYSDTADKRLVAFDELLVDGSRMLLASEIAGIVQNTNEGGDPPTTMFSKAKWYSAKSNDKHRCSNIYSHPGGLRDNLDAQLLEKKRRMQTALIQEATARQNGDKTSADQYLAQANMHRADAQAIADLSKRAAKEVGKTTGEEVKRWDIERYINETARKTAELWVDLVGKYEEQVVASEMTEDEADQALTLLAAIDENINGLISASNFDTANQRIGLVREALDGVAGELEDGDKAGARTALMNAFNGIDIDSVIIRINGNDTPPSSLAYQTPFTVSWSSVNARACWVSGDSIYRNPVSDGVWGTVDDTLGESGSVDLIAQSAKSASASTLNVEISCTVVHDGDPKTVKDSVTFSITRP